MDWANSEDKVEGCCAKGGGRESGVTAVRRQEMTPCDRGGRRECSFLPLFRWIAVVEGGFEKQFFRNCVRPSVWEPASLESVDFASPKVTVSKKRQIPFWTLFSRSNRAISFRPQMGSLPKIVHLLSNRLFL